MKLDPFLTRGGRQAGMGSRAGLKEGRKKIKTAEEKRKQHLD